MDTASGAIEIRQFNDTPEYLTLKNYLEKLKMISSATEVIVPGSVTNERSQYIVSSVFDKSTFPVDRANFSDVNGKECIQKLSQDPRNLLNQVLDKKFALAALSALIAYAENNLQSNFSLNGLKISYKTSEDSMMIDTDTVAALELLASNNGSSKYCLFGFLNNCFTRGGCKLLRSLILEPPTDRVKIQKRQDAVGELKAKEDHLSRLREFLQLLQVDLEHIATKVTRIPRAGSVDTSSRLETEIDLLVYLRHVLERMDSLLEQLTNFDGESFNELSNKLKECGYESILEKIQEVISGECVMTKGCVNFKTSKAFAVKKELSPYLELERDTYAEILEDLTDLTEAIITKHQIEERSCKMIYTVARKFHLQINQKVFQHGVDKRDRPRLIIPKEFIRVDQKGESVFCTTEPMVLMNARLEYKQREINQMSHV